MAMGQDLGTLINPKTAWNHMQMDVNIFQTASPKIGPPIITCSVRWCASTQFKRIKPSLLRETLTGYIKLDEPGLLCLVESSNTTSLGQRIPFRKWIRGRPRNRGGALQRGHHDVYGWDIPYDIYIYIIIYVYISYHHD